MTANEYLTNCSPSSRNDHLIISLFCLLFAFILIKPTHSQNFDQYQRLLHTGPLPEDFLLSSAEQYQLKLDSLSKENRSIRKVKEAFYQQNFYYINEIMLSGKVLFNDSVTAYINQVADQLLRDDPILREKIRLYAVKSPFVNAFAANNGIILVNIGLISRLENEAQLAFILSHEISHFTQKHPLDIFLHDKIPNKATAQTTRNYSSSTILNNRNLHSREKEREADSLGLKRYLASGYDLNAAVSVFDILINNHQTFSSTIFNPAFFESPVLQFPDSFFISKAKRSEKVQDGGANSNTHLKPEIRKQFVKKLITSLSNEGRKHFQISEDKFLHIRNICQFETSYYFLVEKEYEKAIYSAWILLNQHPKNQFLQKIVAHALYGLAKYATAGKLWDVHKEFFPGTEYQPLIQIIEHLESRELAVLALLYNWKISILNPKDIEIQMMIDDLMKTLGKNYPTEFLSSSKNIDPKDSTQNTSFVYQALVAQLADSIFCERMRKNLDSVQRQRERDVFRIQANQQQKRQSQRKLASTGFNLNLNKVVYVDPSYQIIDNRKDSPLQFLESESREQQYIQLLDEYSEKLGLQYDIITTHELKADDVKRFRDLVLLNEWIQEKTNTDGLQMISINHAEIQLLTKKYNTSHFIWTGGLSLTRPRSGRRIAMLAGILFPPALLYSGWYIFTPYQDTFIYTTVYDIESGGYLILYPKLIKMKDKFDVLNSVTYDLVLQIKSPRK